MKYYAASGVSIEVKSFSLLATIYLLRALESLTPFSGGKIQDSKYLVNINSSIL